MNFLIFFYLLFYFFLCRISIDWAVLLLITLLPVYLIRFQIFGIPLTLLEGMILISFFGWFIWHTNFLKFLKGQYKLKDFKQNRKKREKYSFGVEIILMLIISFFAVGVSGFSNESLGAWKAYFFEPALFFILFLNIFQDSEKRKKVYWAMAFSVLVVSIFAIYQKFTGAFIFNDLWTAENTRRATSLFPYPNAVGLYLGPIVLVLIGYLFHLMTNLQIRSQFYKHIQTTFILAAVVLSVLAIYFAKSEGALVGILAGLVIFGLFANKKLRITTIVGIILFSLSIYFYIPAREFAYEKIILMDHSGQIRRSQWEETWEMLKDGRVMHGSGLSHYQETIKPYHAEGIFIKDIYDPDFQRKVVFNDEFKKKVWQPLEIYLYPHNIFLNFWVELGFLGMLLFVWIIVKYFYLGFENLKFKIDNPQYQNERYITLGLIGAMIVIVVHGLVDVPYFKNDLSVLFWILVALIGINRLEYKKELKK